MDSTIILVNEDDNVHMWLNLQMSLCIGTIIRALSEVHNWNINSISHSYFEKQGNNYYMTTCNSPLLYAYSELFKHIHWATLL